MLFLPRVHLLSLPGPHKQKLCISFKCKGLCDRLETGSNVYHFRTEKDVRYCSGCERYFKGGSNRCKCCGCLKRVRKIGAKKKKVLSL